MPPRILPLVQMQSDVEFWVKLTGRGKHSKSVGVTWYWRGILIYWLWHGQNAPSLPASYTGTMDSQESYDIWKGHGGTGFMWNWVGLLYLFRTIYSQWICVVTNGRNHPKYNEMFCLQLYILCSFAACSSGNKILSLWPNSGLWCTANRRAYIFQHDPARVHKDACLYLNYLHHKNIASWNFRRGLQDLIYYRQFFHNIRPIM